ncbi:hypothetical protein V1504DRAFT_465543 [Lipomyces starkeyi]
MDPYRIRLYLAHRTLILSAIAAFLAILNRMIDVFTRRRALLIQDLYRRGTLMSRIDIPSIRFSLDNMLDEDVKLKFRFTKLQLMIVAEELLLPEFIITKCRRKAHKIEALCLLLRRLAYPNRLYDLVRLFGRSRSAMSELIWTTALHIYNRFKHLLYWDDVRLNENFRRICANAIHRKGAALDNCLGFIDGTARPICRLTLHQREVYNGHKRTHALKYQSIVTPDGLIIHMEGP